MKASLSNCERTRTEHTNPPLLTDQHVLNGNRYSYRAVRCDLLSRKIRGTTDPLRSEAESGMALQTCAVKLNAQGCIVYLEKTLRYDISHHINQRSRLNHEPCLAYDSVLSYALLACFYKILIFSVIF